jgi:hypothetical protein
MMPSGLYYARIDASGRTIMRPMLHVR